MSLPHTWFSTECYGSRWTVHARIGSLFADPRRRGSLPLCAVLALTALSGGLVSCHSPADMAGAQYPAVAGALPEGDEPPTDCRLAETLPLADGGQALLYLGRSSQGGEALLAGVVDKDGVPVGESITLSGGTLQTSLFLQGDQAHILWVSEETGEDGVSYGGSLLSFTARDESRPFWSVSWPAAWGVTWNDRGALIQAHGQLDLFDLDGEGGGTYWRSEFFAEDTPEEVRSLAEAYYAPQAAPDQVHLMSLQCVERFGEIEVYAVTAQKIWTGPDGETKRTDLDTAEGQSYLVFSHMQSGYELLAQENAPFSDSVFSVTQRAMGGGWRPDIPAGWSDHGYHF